MMQNNIAQQFRYALQIRKTYKDLQGYSYSKEVDDI